MVHYSFQSIFSSWRVLKETKKSILLVTQGTVCGRMEWRSWWHGVLCIGRKKVCSTAWRRNRWVVVIGEWVARGWSHPLALHTQESNIRPSVTLSALDIRSRERKTIYRLPKWEGENEVFNICLTLSFFVLLNVRLSVLAAFVKMLICVHL